MKRRLLDGFFKRKPKAKPVQHAPVPEKKKLPEHLCFILKQISFQSAYFPELTQIHNSLIKKIDFHSRTIPKITGIAKFDSTLARNMRQMLRLERKINELRLSVRKISSLKQAKSVADKARELESEFNRLKEANFLIFQRHFGPANGNAKLANGKKRRNGQ